MYHAKYALQRLFVGERKSNRGKRERWGERERATERNRERVQLSKQTTGTIATARGG